MQPTRPIIEAKTVTKPVTARDLKISFELLFQVIEAKIAIIKIKVLYENSYDLLRPLPKTNKLTIKSLNVLTLC